MKHILSLFIVIFPLLISAQESIVIGHKEKLYSETLNEERNYWIYLPPSYQDNNYGKASYPVIYLLDGDTHFTTAVAIQKTFTRGMYNNMPECIIVGILNTDRSRDLTPSKSSFKHNGKVLFENSGGANQFSTFIQQELRHQIDSLYRTNGYNILIGHSFGGLFTINTLLDHPLSFNAYIAIDPSLWWNNSETYIKAESKWKETQFLNRFLYIAMAQEDQAEDKQQHSSTIKQFCTHLIDSQQTNNLTASWKYYAAENHGTVIMPGIFHGLKTLFEGIELPVKEIPNNPKLIEEQYRKLSRKLHFNFIPDEILIENLAKYAISVDRKDSALELYEYNCKNYPDSHNAQKNKSKITSPLTTK